MPVRWRRWWSKSSRGTRRRRTKYLVDGGFTQHDQIDAVSAEEVGCTVYAPVPAPKDPKGGSVRPQAGRQSGSGRLANPHGQRGGQSHLKGPCRDGRVRQCTGAESGIVPVAGAWPAQGQGDRAMARVGPQYDACGESACCNEGGAAAAVVG